MANTKSALKRMRQNTKRRLHNRYFRGIARSFVKKARASLAEDELESARENTRRAIEALDKAAAKGVIHKNNAARRKSRLVRQLNALAEQQDNT